MAAVAELERRGDLAALRRAAEAAAPVTLAGSRSLPVVDALGGLLPEGVRRGAVVSVGGSTALALTVAAGASAAGSWVAVAGHRSIGLQAALELGVAAERLLVVPDVPAASWSTVVAALLDAVDVVLALPPRGGVNGGDARRLVARARERESVLVPLGGSRAWPAGADLRLDVASSRWELQGGRLVGRRAVVTASGKGVYARERQAELWLPGPDGGVAACD